MTEHSGLAGSHHRTLVDLLRDRAAREPHAVACVYLKDGLTADRALSFSDLDRHARAIAAHLQDRFSARERLLLMYPPGLDFVSAFWGCLYAGIVPVPVPPPDAFRLKQSAGRIASVSRDAQATGVLTTRDTRSLCRESPGGVLLEGVDQWIATDGIDTSVADAWQCPACKPADLAYLQYTSGSTSTPKGAMVSHENVLHQCRCITTAGNYGDQAATLSWMPHYHDYGLVKGILHPASIGRPTYLMSATTFLKRPIRWLRAIERYHITHSGGPNFAYRHCIAMTTGEERQGLDLSGWQVASCGAEPIFEETIEEFVAAFAPAGFTREAFYPAYGMAEYTLLIALKRPGEPPHIRMLDARSLEEGIVREAPCKKDGRRAVVGCGCPVGDTHVVIVDPVTMRRCRPDQVGEIWLAGGSVTQGYWNKPQETKETFQAYITDSGEGPFLRTGDLGFMQNEMVFVTGRLKDLIIIRGRNHYPHDIEQTVRRCHPALHTGLGVAFSIEEAQGELLVVVQEVARQESLDIDAIMSAIRQAIAEQHDLEVAAIVLVKSGTVPKTSSGKVQRRACRQGFIDHTLPSLAISRLHRPAAASGETPLPVPDLKGVTIETRRMAIETYVIRLVAALLGHDEQTVAAQPLNRLGLDSLKAFELVHRVESAFGVVIPVAAILNGQKPADVAIEVMSRLDHQSADVTALTSASESQSRLYPVSYNQLALWLFHELEPESAAANVAVLIPVGRGIDADILRDAILDLGRQHAILRTTYESGDDGPMQRVHDALAPDWSVVDASAWTWERLRQEAISAAGAPFHLKSGPVWRALLFQGGLHSILLLVAHHIAMDGASMKYLVKQLRHRYQSRRSGVGSEPAEAETAYQHFVTWQRNVVEGSSGERLSAFWGRQLAGELPQYEQLHDRQAGARAARRYEWRAFQLTPAVAQRLRQATRDRGMTLYGALLSAFQILLYRYTGLHDLVIGSPVSGRSRAIFARTVGNCVNVVVLRQTVEGGLSVGDLLDRTHRTVLEALDHQDYPFALLPNILGGDRHRRSGSIAHVLFALQPFELLPEADRRVAPGAALWLGSSDWSDDGYVIPQQGGQFDLSLELSDTGEGLGGCFEYDADLFTGASISRMQHHYARIVEGMLEDWERPIAALPLMDEQERQRVLFTFNSGPVSSDSVPNLIEEIELRASKVPQAVAVVHGTEEISYEELNRRANRLAHYLRGRRVGADVVVGVCLERSVNLIVALLGVAKAGGAYLPLDPEYPTKRLEQMLADSDMRVLLTHTDLLTRLPSDHPHTVCLDSEWPIIAQMPETTPIHEDAPDHLAYVLYTSGTTGRPKGVMIERRSLANYAEAISRHIQLRPEDRVLQFASIGFDTAAEEIWPCLAAGATLVLRTNTMMDSVEEFFAACRRMKITVLDLPTAWWHEVVARMEADAVVWPSTVRAVIIGGERALPHAVARWYEKVGPHVQLVNTYGPTEATIAATIGDMAPAGSPDVSIGRPIQGVQVYLLDADLQPVPIGVTGELYIGGIGLARGYVGRPDLTAERFIEVSLGHGRVRLYRTGDGARWRPDGQLEYRGRTDRQVKMRGYRIELDEVESILGAHPELLQAAVEMREDMPGDQRLIGFIVPRPGSTLSAGRLIEDLKQQLPHYMIPSTFVEMPALPRTEHGKLNRQALHVPRDSRESRIGLTSGYVAPRTATEHVLAQIWGDILQMRDVGIHDNFFELGGNSLLATQVVSRVRGLLHKEVPLRLVFASPTIANLARLIEDVGASKQELALPPLSRASRAEPLPLSFAQERMWVLHRMAPESSAYNIPASVRLQGPLNKEALRCSVAELIRRHESLRTTFDEVNGRPVQIIHQALPPMWMEEDLRRIPKSDRERAAAAHATTEARRPFNLLTGPLLRVLLLQLEDEQHVLVLTTHHIIADHWSYGIIARELVSQYNAHCDGAIRALPPEPQFQYVDFAQWQRAWLQGPVLAAQLEFWKSRLQNLSTLTLPGDRPRPAHHSFLGDHVSLELPWSFIHRLQQVTVREGVTLYMVFLAGFFALLRRLTGQRDIVIGTPIANRHWLATEDMIGTFVNTLVLRADVPDDTDFRQLLATVRDVTLDAYAHQDLPFEKLVEALQPDRTSGGLPIVQVLFNFANTPFARTDFKHLSWTPYEISRGAAQFDLTLSIDPMASRKAYLEFNTDLFDKATIERWLQHYHTLLEALIDSPSQSLSRLPLLREREKRIITVEWNETSTRDQSFVPMTRLFEAQAAAAPERPAIADEKSCLSYGELNRRANQLARHLQRVGVGPETVVAVHMERSCDVLMCLLAIMKAGGAYLPLVPGLPARRMAVMLETAQAGCLVTTHSLLAAVPRRQMPTVMVDQQWEAIEAEDSEDLESAPAPHHLAYVLFTSGSTGVPKGVEIEHRGLSNFLQSMRRAPGIHERDVLLSVTPLSFDIAGLELYLPLIAGARIRLATRQQAVDGHWLKAQLESGDITIMQATPATWRLVLQAGWQKPQAVTMLCGGEALPADLAKALLARGKHLWNLYGPTETTIWSTLEPVRQADGPIFLGRPIANTQVYVLDSNLQPVPVGIPGELYIGGAGVARGYRGNPQLTAERFIANPFIEGSRVYRTGDAVKWSPDGRLQFIGRIDFQVKVRGFRIELGEIETVLGQQAGVEQAVVTIRDHGGEPQLTAYVVMRPGAPFDATAITLFLRERLPDYMIPPVIVRLESIPLTPNGKVDRGALPAPPAAMVATAKEPVVPRDRVELQLVAIWEQVLGISPVGVRDNFFDLGGYSLLALRMFSAIEHVFGKRLPMAVLFHAPTIEHLGRVLREGGYDVRWRSLVAIQTHGTRPPFFVVPGVGGNVLVFARLSKLLGDDQPFYGLQAQGLDGRAKPFIRIEDMARYYIEEIRSVQRRGPYHIGGTCTGGLVAYEIAQQLTAAGERVVLAIMESWHPSSYRRHWRRAPYSLWPALFLARKFAAYLRIMMTIDPRKWAAVAREKFNHVWHSWHDPEDHREADQLLYRDQVSYATFHAAARYTLRPYQGRLLNIIASRRPVAEPTLDTRLAFAEAAASDSRTVAIAAEDSGRLFVPPHVQELARHLQAFWDSETKPHDAGSSASSSQAA